MPDPWTREPRMRRTLLVIAALFGVLLTSAPASSNAPSLLFGGGPIESNDLCGDNGALLVAGVSFDGELWLLTAQAVTPSVGLCALLPTGIGTGVWNPPGQPCVELTSFKICIYDAVDPLSAKTDVRVSIFPPLQGGNEIKAKVTIGRI
jgi:hypothetical protein